MEFCLLLIFTLCAAVAHGEDCIFSFRYNKRDLQYNLTNLKTIQTVNFSGSKDPYSINAKLCKGSGSSLDCGGVKTKICLTKNKKIEIDIGSKIKEVKLNEKDQLLMSFESYTICEQNKNYTTEITFVCTKNKTEYKIANKLSLDNCKYSVELTSVAACPVDDLDIRKICDVSVSIPHSLYKFDLNPLRRLDSNYLVENQHHRFEINICGRLADNNSCGGNITTVCDVTDIYRPRVYAVGYSKNDQLFYDSESKHLRLIQHQRATRKKGRRVEFIFKCDENISPEKTKPTFLSEENSLSKANSQNVAHFEIVTSAVCIPRMASCEIITNNARYNLKPLNKRVGNWAIPNENEGGYFYLNVCDYLNEYGEHIPSTCAAGGKTSACYVNSSGKGISIGSSQIGPIYDGSSIKMSYIGGAYCKNSLKWSTVINFICSHEPQLMHDSTNTTLCVHVFQWKTPRACEISFERKDKCMVTHPQYAGTVFNMSDLRAQYFEVDDYVDNAKFRISICSPLQEPCNGYFDSAVCMSSDEKEMNIGSFTEQLVYDNGKIYMSLEGEKCFNDGPNSVTTIVFVCDYSDSKSIDYKKNWRECTFEFTMYTKYACTRPSMVDCTVRDKKGNIFDLNSLTKLNTNYVIDIGQKKKIILNICHSVINNDLDGVNCQFKSGICLVDYNELLPTHRYKNLGDVNESPRLNGNKIILEMKSGFYNGHITTSVIEFICSNQMKPPILLSNDNFKYTLQMSTTLVCPIHNRH